MNENQIKQIEKILQVKFRDKNNPFGNEEIYRFFDETLNITYEFWYTSHTINIALHDFVDSIMFDANDIYALYTICKDVLQWDTYNIRSK